MFFYHPLKNIPIKPIHISQNIIEGILDFCLVLLTDFPRLLPAHTFVDAVGCHHGLLADKIGIVDSSIDSETRYHEVQMRDSTLSIVVQHGQPFAVGQIHLLR